MMHPACLRALALVPTMLFCGIGTTVNAEQSESAPSTKQTDPNPAPSTAPLTRQMPNNATQTPAQARYGLPRNPIIGPIEDLDMTKPLSLERALRIGLQRQNSIAITKAQADAASARLTQSRSNYYPQVVPTFQYQYSLQPGGSFVVGGNVLRGSNVQETRTDNISIRQNLFDTGVREANVGLSRRSAFAAEYALGDERQNVILNITESYYNLLRNKELVRVQQESVRRAETTLESIRAQVEVDNAAKVDIFQAEADLANAQVALLQAQSDYNVSAVTLKNAMGIVAFQPLVLSEERAKTPDTAPSPAGLEEYVRVAYSNRLDLKQQQERVNAQGYSVRLAHINSGLTVNATVSQGYALDPVAGDFRTFIVSASYPLFDGFNARAAVRENKAGLEQERRTLDLLQQNVRLNVEQSYLVRELSRRRIAAADVAVRAGRINYDAALAKQREGVVNVLDVINAQVQLVNAEVALVQAIYDFYVAEARLQRSIGLNDPVYIPRVPGAKPARPDVPLGLNNVTPSTVAQNAPKSSASGALSPDGATDATGRKP